MKIVFIVVIIFIAIIVFTNIFKRKPFGIELLEVVQNAIVIDKKSTTYPPLTVEQETLQFQDRTLKKVRLSATQGSSFEGTIKHICSLLFADYTIKEIASKNNYYLFELKNATELFYLLAYNQNKKALHLLYPVTQKEIASLFDTPLSLKETPLPKNPVEITLDGKTMTLENFIRYKR